MQHAQTKKTQIISLYTNGINDIQELATLTESKPSYVATVLQDSGLLTGYFDLYTHSTHPMNVYSQLFRQKLGFKDEATSRAGVDLLEHHYRLFAGEKDRAGQHHALSVALTMYDRARWCGKQKEADIYKNWLLSHLDDDREPAH